MSQDDQPANIEKREGGRGGLALIMADLGNPNKARDTARIFARSIEAGLVDLFSVDYQAARREATLLAKSDKPRLKAVGIKLLAAMANHDRQMLEAADKAAKLDAGTATENIEHRFVAYVEGIDESKV